MKELKKLMSIAIADKNVGNFSSMEANTAAINAAIAHFGIDPENITARELRKHSADLFAIIEEVFDEAIPARLDEVIGRFAEIRQIGRDERPEFTIKTTHASKRRFIQAIKPGARGGVYSARRLDGKTVYVKTSVHTVSYQVTLEEILLGVRTLAEGMALILEGFMEILYKEIFNSLMGLKTASTLPAPNQESGSFDHAKLDGLVRIAKAYGTPVIFGLHNALDRLDNMAGRSNVQWSEQDRLDVRNMGRIGVYKGTQLIEIPNFLEDATNANWYFDTEDIFITNADAKPVKVILQGDAYTTEVDEPHGGKEFHMHKIAGATVVTANNFCIYKDIT